MYISVEVQETFEFLSKKFLVLAVIFQVLIYVLVLFLLAGLGGLTEDLRDHLKSSTAAKKAVKSKKESSSSSSSSSSDSSSSSSSSSSSEDERAKRKRKKLKKKAATKKKGQNENRKQSRSPQRPEIKKISAGSKGDRSRKRDDESASPSR